MRRSFVETTFYTFLNFIISFFAGVVLARVLGAEARGAYGTLLLYGQMTTLLLTFSVFDGFIISRTPGTILKDEEARIGALFLAVRPYAPLFLIVGPVMSSYLLADEISLSILSCAIFFFFHGLGVAITQIIITSSRSVRDFRIANIDRILPPALLSLFFLIAILMKIDLDLEKALMLFILSRVSIIFLAYRRIGVPKARCKVKRLFRSIRRNGRRLHAAYTINLVSSQFDKAIIPFIWSLNDVGYYYVAASIVATGYALVNQSLSIVLLPFLASERLEFSKLLKKLLLATFAAGVLICATSFALSPMLIKIFYGDDFYPSVEIANWMAFTLVLSPMRALLIDVGKSKLSKSFLSASLFSSLVVTILLLLVLGSAQPMSLFCGIFVGNLVLILMLLFSAWRSGLIFAMRS